MTTTLLIRFQLITALTCGALAQEPAPAIGFLGIGYGRSMEAKRSHVAPGAVTYFYFTGLPFAKAGNNVILENNWPEELSGIALEFETGNEIIRARLGRVEHTYTCNRDGTPAEPLAEVPVSCILTAITAQVPWEINSAPSLNTLVTPVTRMTLVTPTGRSRPFSILGVTSSLRLLSTKEFGRGLEEDGGEEGRNLRLWVVTPRQEVRPGDQISFYSYGLGRPAWPVPPGQQAGEEVPVPKRIIVVVHYLPGLPVLRFRPGYATFATLPGSIAVEPDSIELMADKVGVYEIKLTIPQPPREMRLPECTFSLPNLTVTIAVGARTPEGNILLDGATPTDGFSLCLRPASE